MAAPANPLLPGPAAYRAAIANGDACLAKAAAALPPMQPVQTPPLSIAGTAELSTFSMQP